MQASGKVWISMYMMVNYTVKLPIFRDDALSMFNS